MSSPSNSELSSSIEALSSKLSNPLPPLDDRESSLPSQLASIIDHTLLAPTATKDDIKRVCKEAIQLQAATVCVNSSMIPTAVEALKGTQVLPISVVGFPFGAMESDSKAQEAKTAVQQGAKEIDMVSARESLHLVSQEELSMTLAHVNMQRSKCPKDKLKL